MASTEEITTEKIMEVKAEVLNKRAKWIYEFAQALAESSGMMTTVIKTGDEINRIVLALCPRDFALYECEALRRVEAGEVPEGTRHERIETNGPG